MPEALLDNPFSDLTFDPGQPRDEKGRWANGLGDSGWSAEEMSEYVRHLDNAQKQAIADYTVGDFVEINTGLRDARGEWDATPSAWKGDIGAMTEAFDTNPLPAMTLYRGGSSSEVSRLFEQGKLHGAILRDDGFTSTSLDPGVVEGFVELGREGGWDDEDAETDKIAIRETISVPGDTPGGYVASLSAFPEQEEVVLQRGNKRRIDDWRWNAVEEILEIKTTVIK